MPTPGSAFGSTRGYAPVPLPGLRCEEVRVAGDVGRHVDHLNEALCCRA
ncbi:MAG: hypothetical protein IT365_15535 [Candidatus Hydrogenedentes bacterium]|nr:hypothetical protein [Candidatus Hydrogenedentota bacterium]